jgi:hypothetical protein
VLQTEGVQPIDGLGDVEVGFGLRSGPRH